MTNTQASVRRRFGVLAVIVAVALGIAGVFMSGAAFADSPFESAPQPFIAGGVSVGFQLDGEIGFWDPTPDSFSYQWYSNTVPIAGASGTTTTNDGDVYYTPTSADEGNTITLSVTATKAGFTTTTETSDPTDAVGAPFVTTDTPTISGSTTVGSALTANPGTWGPAAAVLTYQWERNGEDIEDGTSQTYVTVPRDSGQQLSVDVTGTANGYQDSSATSDSFGPISGVGLTISGTITGFPVGGGSTAEPLSNIVVEAYQGNDTPYIAYTYTDSDGHYSIPFGAGASPDGYTVQFNQRAGISTDTWTNYVTEWLGGAADQEDGTTFSLTSASPNYVANDQLALGATITGTVKDQNGVPLSDADVYAHPVDQGNGPSAQTDSNGNYTLRQVSTADTIVVANPQAQYTGSDQDTVIYNQQWWDHAATEAAATPVSITAGQTTSGINFDATLESTITGRVVDSSGNGVPYMDFIPWNYDPDDNDYVGPNEGPFVTDANGYFTLPADGWEGYKLQFFDTLGADDGQTVSRTVPFDTEFYGGTGTLASATALTFTGQSDHIEIGNVVVTPHSGGPGWSGTPQIDPVEGDASFVQIDGAAATPGTATVATQWYLDSVAIPGATSGDYQLTGDETGHVLTATMTASLPGFADASTTATLDLRQNFAVTTAPTITGTTQVGNTLTVGGGVYNPTPDTTSYQWYRQSGTNTPTAISGATTSSYTLTGTDAGDTISVSVTLAKSGYHTHTLSVATTGTIIPGILSSSTPTISGTPVNGNVLTANTTAWTPGTVALSYQWFDGSTPISGATLQTYTIQTSDIGSQIQVQVTGTETGYDQATASSAQTAVVVGTPMTPVAPTISDAAQPSTPTFGDTLVASAPTWAPSGTSFTYQWLRNNVAISGANSASYSIVALDVGTQLSVTFTGTKTGYATTASTSAQTATVVGATFTENSKPSISGPSAGNEYSVNFGGWSPAPSSETYQWSANGSTISGATSSKYTPAAQYAGQTLSVVVVVQLSGYSNAQDTATASGTVVGRFSSDPAPTISGTVGVGDTVTATPGAWTPTPDTVGYTWVSYGSSGSCTTGFTAIPGATTSTYLITAGFAGDHLCVRQTDDLTNFQETTVSSTSTAAVANGTLTTVTPTVSGTPTFGNSLTAQPGTWTPSGETFSYQWLRTVGTANPVAITGATSATYALQSTDVGTVATPITISVAVTGALAGYTSATVTSGTTTAIQPEAFATTSPATLSPSSVATGGTLTASTGTWSPAATFTYQWYSNENLIQDQTGKTFLVTNAYVGQSITVRITGAFPGYAATTLESGSVVPSNSWTTSPAPTITGSAKVGATITAHAGTWTGPDGPINYTYLWTYGSTNVGPSAQSTEDTADFIIPAAAFGHTITVTVNAYADGYPDVPKQSSKTVTVTVGALTTAVPTISGTLAVGNTLTADHGEWAPVGTTFKYEWYRGSTSISGATSSTYTLTGSDDGQKIKVKVTGSATGYTPASATSAATTDIAAGTITYTQPTIVGSATYRTRLSIDKGTWTPSTATFAYKWYRDGTAISGATSSTYTIGTGSIGHVLTVKVSASKSGYTSVSSTSGPTAKITDASFVTAPTPTISGTLAVGSTLAAAHGTSSPSTSVTHAYQWYRDGIAIPSATSSTYKLVTADAAETITVQLTYGLTGYFSETEGSASTTDIWVRGTPTISGTAKVGDTLTVSKGTWSPDPGADGFTYQWYATASSTKPIANATGSTLQLTSAQSGHTITVKVTATDAADGYAPITSSASKATAKVAS